MVDVTIRAQRGLAEALLSLSEPGPPTACPSGAGCWRLARKSPHSISALAMQVLGIQLSQPAHWVPTLHREGQVVIKCLHG